MSRFPNSAAAPDVDDEIAAVVRAGCFPSQEDVIREALQTLLVVNPHLRREAAIRRYLDEEITLGRAAELAGMTRWRFRELLAQRGISNEIEARPGVLKIVKSRAFFGIAFCEDFCFVMAS
jgi:predicted HTH domain antitoxin